MLDLRHQQCSSCIGDTSSCRRWGMLVVSQGAAQKAQIVKGQNQNHHAAQSDTADPSVNIKQKLNNM